MPLTDTKIRNAKPQEKPYSLQDGQGLYLDVRPTGAKIWRYRFWLTPKKDGRYTIGEYPGVSLADARREREWAREQVKQGKNPTIVKDTEKLMVMGDAENTFKSIAEEWYERKCQAWAEKTQIVNRGFLDKHILPSIGKIPVKDVKAAHILALMRSLEKADNAYSAGKVRQICSAVFCYAVSTLRAEVDPSYALRGAVMQKPTTHARPATTEELRQLFVALSNYKSPVMVICIKMLVMTFVRQQELRFARWEDNPNAIWQGSTWARIPGAGKTIRLANSTGSDVLQQGGSDSVALTGTNMPPHVHPVNLRTGQYDYGTKNTSQDNHAHTVPLRSIGKLTGGSQDGSSDDIISTQSTSTTSYQHAHTVAIGAHDHPVQGDTGSTGDGTQFSIVNQFVKLAGWYRTA